MHDLVGLVLDGEQVIVRDRLEVRDVQVSLVRALLGTSLNETYGCFSN